MICRVYTQQIIVEAKLAKYSGSQPEHLNYLRTGAATGANVSCLLVLRTSPLCTMVTA